MKKKTLKLKQETYQEAGMHALPNPDNRVSMGESVKKLGGK